MTKSKCSVSHDYCPFTADFWEWGTAGDVANDNCPINHYKSSTIIYTADNPHYFKCTGHENDKISMVLNDTCRYYGIARAKELRKEFIKNREDF